jgi:hypothetical protein
MQSQPGQESSPQPLPDHVQAKIWKFVRNEIRKQENRAGAGHIEVEVTATQDSPSAAVAAGLEEAVNRLDQRENLGEAIGVAETK